MPRNITVTFEDGSTHVYQNAPDNVTPQQVSQRAQQEFGKGVKALDGGRKPAPKAKAPEPSFLDQLGTTALQRGAALVKSVGYPFTMLEDTARVMQTGVNQALDFAGTNALSAVGLKDAANWWHKGATGAQQQINRTPTFRGTVEAAVKPPTSTGGQVADFVTELVGGSLVRIPGGKARPTAPAPTPAVSPTRAEQVIQAGKDAGVRVMTSDVKPPTTFVGKTAQSVGERIPFAGTGGPRQAQQVERVTAAKDLLAQYGIHESDDLFAGAGNALDDVATDLVAKRGKELTALTGAKSSVITRIQGAVPVPQATKVIDDEVARLKSLNSAELSPVIAKLEGWKTSLQGQSLQNIDELRAMMGKAFDDPSLASIKDIGTKSLQRIYGPLRADMGNFIRAKGGQQAFSKWKGANDRLSAMAGELRSNAFKSVLRNADTTPETVGKLLFSQKPSDVARLYQGLSPAGKAKARAAILQRAAEKSGGIGDNISPDRFVTNILALGKQVGVFFNGQARAELAGFARLMQATQRAATASVAPPTGVQNSLPIIGLGLGQMFGAMGGATVGAGLGVFARAYESAPVRNMLVGLSKTTAGSPQEAALLQRLGASFTAALEGQSARVASVANENTAAQLVAAQPQQEQEQQTPLQ